MNTKIKKLIDIASAEIGVRETGQNFVKYNDWYWGNGIGGADYPWCVAFVNWCLNQASMDYPKTAHCTYVRNYAIEHNQWVTSDYKEGDIFILPGDTHTGIIVGIGENGYVTTIEGNYADKVAKVFRKTSEFAGAYRPDYGEETEETAQDDGLVVDDAPVVMSATVEMPIIHKGDDSYNPYVELAMYLLRMHDCPPQRSLKINGRYDGEAGEYFWIAVDVFQTVNNINGELDMIGQLTWSKLLGV